MEDVGSHTEYIIPTVLAAYALGSITTGVVFLIMGKYKVIFYLNQIIHIYLFF